MLGIKLTSSYLLHGSCLDLEPNRWSEVLLPNFIGQLGFDMFNHLGLRFSGAFLMGNRQ